MKKIISSVVASLIIGTSAVYAADSDVYATVNGENITKQDVQQIIRNPQVSFESLPQMTKDNIINQIIERKLLAKNALDTDIVNSKDFKDALNNIKQELALEFWMQSEYKKLSTSEKEKKEFYEQNKDKFKKDAMLKASHILSKTEADAKAIIAELKKASKSQIKAKFAELAKAKSTGPSATNGGQLGEFSPKTMVPEFSAAATALNVGEFSSKPVKTQFGYHVILLEDKKDAKVLSYEEVSPNLDKVLIQKKFTKIVKDTANKLKKEAKITIK